MLKQCQAATAVLGICITILAVTQFYYLATFHVEDDETSTVLRPVNRLYYVARFGLGHRLSKLSAAYHLASDVLNLPNMELHWGSCKTGELDVFSFLFGTHILVLRKPRGLKDSKDRQILVRNDVAGYYAGQSYKNAQIVLPSHYYLNSRNSPWKKKMQLDRILFQDLLQRFTQRTPEIARFQETSSWHTHTIIGLHVRAGNGEKDHFAASGRTVTNTTTVLENVCMLLRKYAVEHLQGRPVHIFLATDTESVIATVQRACQFQNDVYPGIPVNVLPQTRVQPSQGVSYHAWDQGQACFQGWQSSMMDMALLAHSNILVAGMRSTFTQILPRALVMGRGERYCEVEEETGRTMTCWDEEDDWLFQTSRGYTYSLDESAVPVVHKLLVHLPDVEPNVWIDKAKTFLDNLESISTTFAYGDRFDPKYRKPGQTFQKEWTLAP